LWIINKIIITPILRNFAITISNGNRFNACIVEKISTQVLKKDSLELSEKNADLLNPLKTQIEDFRKKIEGLSTEQVKDRSSLEQQIKTLTDAHKNTLEGTQKLTNALTYDNKQQGDWGEMILESILEDSGLSKGEQYHTLESIIMSLSSGKCTITSGLDALPSSSLSVDCTW
jgi:hypothetical protein